MSAWNPLDAASGLALSSSNRIATDTAGVAWSTVRADLAIPTGRFYFEITCNASAASGIGSPWHDGWLAGIADSSQSLAAAIGFSGHSAAYSTVGFDHFFEVMQFYANGGFVAICTDLLVAGGVLCVAIDTINMKIWGHVCLGGVQDWNGGFDTATDPTNNINGFDISFLTPPIYPAFSSQYVGNQATINLTGPFACTAPSGFGLIPLPRAQRITVLGIGFSAAPGGATTIPITEQHFLSYAGSPLQLRAPTVVGNLDVVVNGLLQDPANLLVSGTQVSFAAGHTPSTGADVAIVVYGGGAATSCRLQAETLAYTVSQSWTLQFPDTETVPEHAGTIVDVNGVRLTPPLTFYGAITASQRFFTMDTVPDVGVTIKIYVKLPNQTVILYPSPIPICTTTSPSSPYPLHVVLPIGAVLPTDPASGWFVLYLGNVIACNPAFLSDTVICVLYQDHDYTVEAGVLTVLTSLLSPDVVVAFTFANAGRLGIQTHTFAATDDGVYPLIPPPPSPANELDGNPPPVNQAWVASGGLTLCNGADFGFTDDALHIEVTRQGSGRIVATVLTGTVALPAARRLTATITPAVLRMTPVLDGSGHPVTEVPPFGSTPAPLQHMANTWEGTQLLDEHAGVLATSLAAGDATAVISFPAVPLSPRLIPEAPFAVPDTVHKRPGIVWIGGERIEYFTLQVTGTTATIGQLRRGTAGTAIWPSYSAGTMVYDGGARRTVDLDVPGLET